jgi:hypothetical protein
VAFLQDYLVVSSVMLFQSFQYIRLIGHVCITGGGLLQRHIMHIHLVRGATPWLIIGGEISYCLYLVLMMF